MRQGPNSGPLPLSFNVKLGYVKRSSKNSSSLNIQLKGVMVLCIRGRREGQSIGSVSLSACNSVEYSDVGISDVIKDIPNMSPVVSHRSKPGVVVVGKLVGS